MRATLPPWQPFSSERPPRIQSADFVIIRRQRQHSRTYAERNCTLASRRFLAWTIDNGVPRRPECQVALITGSGLDTLAVPSAGASDALALLRAVRSTGGGPVGQSVGSGQSDHCGACAGWAVRPDRRRCSTAAHAGWSRVNGAGFVRCAAGFVATGGITAEALEAVIGPIGQGPPPAAAQALRSPGQLQSHYAPELPVRMNAVTVANDEALLAFGRPCEGAGAIFQLSDAADVIEAAARLFDGLRWLDAEGQRRGLRGIAAMPVPDAGLGRAINDRLRRAAAPRG